MSKMRFAPLMGLAVMVVIFAGLAHALEKIDFATSMRDNSRMVLPVLAAEQKGFWKQHGLEVKWIPFQAGGAFFQAMAAGSLPTGISGASSAIQAQSRGVPVIIVADLQAPDSFYIWVRADSSIREPKDLKGLRLGVSRFGGVSHGYGRVVVKALGLEKDIKIVAAGGTGSLIAALKSGAVDASVNTSTILMPLKVKGEIRDIANVDDYLPKEWIDTTVVARRPFLEKSPDTVEQVVKAIVQATAFVGENRAWAIEALKSFYGFSQEVAAKTYDPLRYGKDGKINPKALENVRQFLMDYGIVAKDKAPALRDMYTSRFVE